MSLNNDNWCKSKQCWTINRFKLLIGLQSGIPSPISLQSGIYFSNGSLMRRVVLWWGMSVSYEACLSPVKNVGLWWVSNDAYRSTIRYIGLHWISDQTFLCLWWVLNWSLIYKFEICTGPPVSGVYVNLLLNAFYRAGLQCILHFWIKKEKIIICK